LFDLYDRELNFFGKFYARRDFLNVIKKESSHCDAQRHLGLIYQRMKQIPDDPLLKEPHGRGSGVYRETWSLKDESTDKKAFNYFLGAASCMESALHNLRARIDSVPLLDLKPNEKFLLTDRLKNRLINMRISSAANIEMMINGHPEIPLPKGKIIKNL
jgi:hypothetical protein